MKGLKAYRLDVPPMLADRGIDRMLAFAVPLTVRFRGIKVREGTLLHGPEGWGEWSPFWDYDPVESASWLRAGIEGATRRLPVARRDRVPINVTIPVVDADRAGRMAAESACLTAKVKVADPRSDLREDCRRVAAVREAMPDGHIRVDANTAWDVDAAVRAITELDAAAEGLEYVEQPCASVAELAQVRRKVNVPVAADESVRRAEDPLAVARAGAADLLIVKAQPLGGVARALEVIDATGLPAVVSSALDTSIGPGSALSAPVAAVTARRTRASRRSSAGNPAGTSVLRRGADPKIPVWTVVWLAPVCHISAGRSAERTISGTPAASASRTAG